VWQVTRERIAVKKKEKALELKRLRKQMSAEIVTVKQCEQLKHRERCLEMRRIREERKKKREEDWVSVTWCRPSIIITSTSPLLMGYTTLSGQA